MGIVKVAIWQVSWRNGRPRFTPSPSLRRKHRCKGEDLRHPDGRWFSLEEAVAWANAKRAELAARAQAKAAGVRAPPARRARGLSVADLFDAWFSSPRFTGGTARGRRREGGLSASSVRDYRGKARVLLAFDPELAAAPPAAVSEIVAQAVYERLWEEKGLHMARGIVAVASSCWTWAGGRGLAGLTRAANPWRQVRKTVPEPRQMVLEDYEIAAWVAACDAPDRHGLRRPELGDAILLGLFTGQRQGDRLRLLDRGRDDKGRRLFAQAKTGAIVAVPETPQLAARLAAAIERRRARGIVDPHVVLDERRGRPFRPDHYRHLIAERRQMAIAGVPDDAATAAARAAGRNDPAPVWRVAPCPSLAGKREQDLRDTAVTWLARAGCTVLEIAAITGHSLASIHGVLRHYLALHPEMADSAIGKLMAWMQEHGVAV